MNRNFEVFLQDDVYFRTEGGEYEKKTAEHSFVRLDMGMLLNLINNLAQTTAGALTLVINPTGGEDDE